MGYSKDMPNCTNMVCLCLFRTEEIAGFSEHDQVTKSKLGDVLVLNVSDMLCFYKPNSVFTHPFSAKR